MKKLTFFMLMAVGLLIGTQAWAEERTAGTAEDLTAAVSAASAGDVIKLTAPITLAANCTIPKNLTLNLNEQTISGAGYLYISGSEFSIVGNGSISSTGSYTMYMPNASTLTIGNAGDDIVLGDAKNVYFRNSSTLNYNSTSPLKNLYCYYDLTVNVGTTGVVNWSAGKMYDEVTVINNNSFETSLGSSYVLSIDNKAGATAKISGGSYTKAVTITNAGTFEITGGTFSNSVSFTSNTGTISISGGSFCDAAYQNVKDFIASGYKWIDALEGSTLCKKVVDESYEVPAVASYGGNTYASFAIAIGAAEQNTADQAPAITLLQDDEISSTLKLTKNYTIDLGGKALTGTGATSYLNITNGTSFTLQNGSISVASNYGGMRVSAANQNVILDNVTIENSKASKPAILVENLKSITINSNVTLSGQSVGLLADNGTTQGTIGNIINHSAHADIKVCAENYDYGYTTYLKDITNDGGSSVIISSGTLILSSNYTKLSQYVENGLKALLHPISAGSATLVYEITQYSVVASAGDYSYTTLNEAINASSANAPAKMLKSMSTSSYFDVAGDWWLDLNGYTFSVTNYGVRVKGNITIMDSSEGHTGKLVNNQGLRLFDVRQAGSSIKIQNATCETTADYGMMYYNDSYNYSVVLDGPYTHLNVPNGTAIGICGKTPTSTVTVRNGATITAGDFCIANLGTYTDMNTTMNIESGAKLTSTTAAAIYHPGGGYLNVSGENTSITGAETAIEIRAGELNISGGTLTSTYDGFVCDRNGSGTTTKGAALAIAQHTTKLPINVTISGGHFKGNYPISQCNPQENEAEYVALLDIEVTGGYFWADNGTSIVSHTEDRRLFLKGGVYNLDPAAFTVNGFFSGNNQPELYAGSYAQGYVYKVAQHDITEEETKSDGTTDWAQTTTWNTDLVPDYATNVTIGKNIEVTTSAEANTITINTGSTLTVKEGGTLIIGNGGIIGATDETFKVEAGGQVLIAPNAENANLRGSVELLADRAGLKPSETEYTGQGSQMYWQHIAIPTNGAPESITPSVPGRTFFNTWDIVKGWQNVGTDALNTPFKGYNLGNFHPYSADGSQSITYTFVGQLVGNQPDYMVFAREGHSFFGNSYLAPLDVATLFGTLYNPDLEYTLNIYDSQTEMYQPVNKGTYAILGITEIKPLQGFFIYAQNATQAQLDYNSAVFTAYLNKHAVGGQPSTLAPAHKAAKTNMYDKMAQITIAASTGEKDAIYLFEEANFSDAEDNGFDARNLEHSGLDMSIVGSYADLSVLATDNLEGALLNINTNNAVEYTMTFSHVQGDMTLTDNMTGAVITMQEGATYTFAAQPNAQLDGRFTINAVGKVPTNMDKVKAASAAKGIYTIMGQYVGEATNWNALPAGIYIVDGIRVCK